MSDVLQDQRGAGRSLEQREQAGLGMGQMATCRRLRKRGVPRDSKRPLGMNTTDGRWRSKSSELGLKFERRRAHVSSAFFLEKKRRMHEESAGVTGRGPWEGSGVWGSRGILDKNSRASLLLMWPEAVVRGASWREGLGPPWLHRSWEREAQN